MLTHTLFIRPRHPLAPLGRHRAAPASPSSLASPTPPLCTLLLHSRFSELLSSGGTRHFVGFVGLVEGGASAGGHPVALRVTLCFNIQSGKPEKLSPPRVLTYGRTLFDCFELVKEESAILWTKRQPHGRRGSEGGGGSGGSGGGGGARNTSHILRFESFDTAVAVWLSLSSSLDALVESGWEQLHRSVRSPIPTRRAAAGRSEGRGWGTDRMGVVAGAQSRLDGLDGGTRVTRGDARSEGDTKDDEEGEGGEDGKRTTVFVFDW